MTAIDRLLHRAAALRAAREADFAARCPDAPGFRPGELLWLHENQLSRVFRWMLDPKESHGAEARFAELFVDAVRRAGIDLAAAFVPHDAACEVPTRRGTGRIDILVRDKEGRTCIAIENKPWAEWQKNQVDRYLRDQLCQREAVTVVALIGGQGNAIDELQRHWNGSPRSRSAGLPRNVGALDYRAVVAWIRDCARNTKSPRIGAFLNDIAAYCETHVLGVSPMFDPQALAADLAERDPEMIRAAIEVADAVPALYEALARRLARDLALLDSSISAKPICRYRMWGLELPTPAGTFTLILFGAGWSPWIGMSNRKEAAAFAGASGWVEEAPDWPRWIYLSELATQPAIRLLAAVERKAVPDIVDAVQDLITDLVPPASESGGSMSS